MEELEEIRSHMQRISSEMLMKSVGMTKEFYSFKGQWIVGEYPDSAAESTGVDIDAEEYRESHKKWILELREKYEGYSFETSEDSIIYFMLLCELGYYYDDYAELQIIFRQPPTLRIVPSFYASLFG